MILSFDKACDLISWVELQKRNIKKTDLGEMKYYCAKFSNPETHHKKIHVTGTNGKGSTVAFLRSILMNMGYNVGTFTSPYITVFNERIEVNGINISDSDLLKYGNRILQKYPEFIKDGFRLPSFFEFVTLLSFLYFKDQNLDFVIYEVGIGGRLDSTNVIDSILSIITNVSIEHTNILGETKEEILKEKLGIVKDSSSLVCGVKDQNLIEQVKNDAKEKNVTLYMSHLTAFEIKKVDLLSSEFFLEGFGNFKTNLPGAHQVENAICAILASYALFKKGFLKKWKKDEFCVLLNEGLQKVHWPGRLEVISKDPLILVDGAHNIDGIKRVCEYVKSLDLQEKRAVIAISKDKEIKKMLDLIDETFDDVIFTRYEYNRSASPKLLYEMSQSKNKTLTNSINEAKQIIDREKKPFTIYLGSLYLVSDIRKLYEK